MEESSRLSLMLKILAKLRSPENKITSKSLWGFQSNIYFFIPFLAAPRGMRDLSSPTRDRTCAPYTSRWILKHWDHQGSPLYLSDKTQTPYLCPTPTPAFQVSNTEILKCVFTMTVSCTLQFSIHKMKRQALLK